MSANKTHAKRPADEIAGPLCSSKTANPEYSDAPTCLRCRTILERESRSRFMHGFDAGVRSALKRFASQIPFEVAPQTSKRKPFATVSGPRINPRNRHTSSKPHVFTSFTGSRSSNVTVTHTDTPPSFLSRREQLDIVSKRLNAQPSREFRAHVRVSGE